MLSWELYGLSVRYAHQDNSNLVVLVNKLSSRSWDSTLLSSSLAVDVLSLLKPHRSFVVLGMVANSIRRSVVSWLLSLACCVYGPACPSLYRSRTGPPVYIRHRSSCIGPAPVFLYTSLTYLPVYIPDRSSCIHPLLLRYRSRIAFLLIDPTPFLLY